MHAQAGFRLPRICLPQPRIDLEKWAVIACDQHTSEPEYWRSVEREVGDAPSSLHLIFPEVHLGSADAPARIGRIQDTMRSYLAQGVLVEHDSSGRPGAMSNLVAMSVIPPLTRNVPTLLNVGFNGLVAGSKTDPELAPMFWDARVESLERQALEPIKSREEMRGDACRESEAIAQAVGRVGAIDEYRELFSAAFGPPQSAAVTAAHLAQAIAAFERSLVTANTPYDRFLRGDKSALNAEQQRGLQVFQDAGCIQCHGGPMFSDYKLHFIGVSDGAVGSRREFRTPTLRNLKHTAPYMHDGSLRTLDSVLLFYDGLAEAVVESLDGGVSAAQPPLDPLLRRMNLNPEDVPALTAFLGALNDDQYDQTTPAKVPSGLLVGGNIRKP